MEWHAHSGLALIFVEGQETIHSQARLLLNEKQSLTNLRECVPQDLLSSFTEEVDEESFTHQNQTSSNESTWPVSAAAIVLLISILSTVVAILFFGRLQNGSWSMTRARAETQRQRYSLVEMEDGDTSDDEAQEKEDVPCQNR